MATPVEANSKVTVYEFMNPLTFGAMYSTQRSLNAEYPPTGRLFQLYATGDVTGETRIPVYPSYYNFPDGTKANVLTASADPTSLPNITLPTPNQRPLGYVSTSTAPDREQLFQHWGRPGAPLSYRFDGDSALEYYTANTNINNEAVYMPKVLSFDVTAAGDDVSIKDESGTEVTSITAYVGRGNLLRFRTTQSGLTFATFSIYEVDANNVLQTYDGNFYIETWTPQEIHVVDDNLRTSGQVDYSFLLTMRDGTTFYHHDPKIQNRSSLPPSGVTA